MTFKTANYIIFDNLEELEYWVREKEIYDERDLPEELCEEDLVIEVDEDTFEWAKEEYERELNKDWYELEVEKLYKKIDDEMKAKETYMSRFLNSWNF